MLVLGLETATERASAVVAENDVELAAWRDATHQDLCRRLASEVSGVLSAAGQSFEQLDLVAVGLGPGAFTALRVGLATAKGIALARAVPLVGVPSLEAMCHQVRGQLSGLVCPILDARRGEVYGAIYRAAEDGFERVEPEFAAGPTELAGKLRSTGAEVTVFGQLDRTPTDAIGHALGDPRKLWRERTVVPDALAVAQLGRRRYAVEGSADLASLRPIYVRMSYAEERFDIDLGLR